MGVAHQPWESQSPAQVILIDGPFKVDGLDHISFRGENWHKGGCDFYAKCTRCATPEVRAGGMAGKAKVIRWANAHKCSAVIACTEGEEDKNLFRD